jgi:hypothetical protein
MCTRLDGSNRPGHCNGFTALRSIVYVFHLAETQGGLDRWAPAISRDLNSRFFIMGFPQYFTMPGIQSDAPELNSDIDRHNEDAVVEERLGVECARECELHLVQDTKDEKEEAREPAQIHAAMLTNPSRLVALASEKKLDDAGAEENSS